MIDEIDKYFRVAYLLRCFSFSRTSDNRDKKLLTKVFAPLKRFTMHVSTNKKKKSYKDVMASCAAWKVFFKQFHFTHVVGYRYLSKSIMIGYNIDVVTNF